MGMKTLDHATRIQLLSAYDERCEQGIVHTPEYRLRMARERVIYLDGRIAVTRIAKEVEVLMSTLGQRR